MLKTQALLLNLVKKISGESQTITQTEEEIDKLRSVSQADLRFKPFNESESLS